MAVDVLTDAHAEKVLALHNHVVAELDIMIRRVLCMEKGNIT